VKIATWNINSVRIRLPHILDWLKAHSPDILCLQETKVTDEAFPVEAFHNMRYQIVYAGQKTYNGVATLSRKPLDAVMTELPEIHGTQKRFVAVTTDGMRVLNVYVPNGEAVGSEKFAYKLFWLKALKRFVIKELKTYPKLAVVGDFNIAPEPRDVHDPAAWEGRVLFSEKERAAFKELVKTGLTDVFRKFEQPEKSFSWWDYRQGAFRRNMGLRIDHILCGQAMTESCTACYVDRGLRGVDRPSDHAPVVAIFNNG